MKTYVLSKMNIHKLKIHQVEGVVDTYEGNRIPLSNKELSGIVAYLSRVYSNTAVPDIMARIKSDEGFVINGNVDKQIYGAFIQSFNNKLVAVKNTQPDKYKQTVRNRVPCDTDGKWKLIRSASKDHIHIAPRKHKTEKKPYDESWINSVCIPNSWKSSFFNDADTMHVAVGSMHYITAADGKVFKFWSDRMDNEFNRQVDAYKNSKQGE